MRDSLIDHIDTPPDKTQYIPVKKYNDPVLLLGVMINSMYDHARTQLEERDNHARVTCNDKHFYGVTLTPNNYFNSVVDKITSVPLGSNQSAYMYKQRLKLYGLTCDSCLVHLSHNIFPIDAENVETISINTRYNMNNNLFVTNNKDVPWFTQYVNPKIYILTHEC